MRSVPRVIRPVVLLALVAGGGGCGGASEPTPESPPDAAVEPGWVVVDFEDGTTKAQFDDWERAWGIDLEFNSTVGRRSGVTLGRVAGDGASLLARIRRHPAVEAAEPLFRYEAFHVPNDPDFKYQWHMEQVHAPRAWDLGRGEGVVVAVVDTGVAYRDFETRYRRVEDLQGVRFVPGWDFVHDREEALDDHGHGTHVAGTLAQATDNGVGVTGLAHGARLMPVKVLDARGMAHSADLADGIRFAADHGAKVVNLSLGGGGWSRVVSAAVRHARKRGALVVAAAGNTGLGFVSFPASHPDVLAVSATRFDETPAPYTSWGRGVELAAPGGDKRVDQNGDGRPDGVLQNTIARGDPTRSVYEYYQGTSMATPHVAAAAALVMGTGITDPDDVRRVLRGTARKVHGRTGWDERYGHGIVDAAAALERARVRPGMGRLAWAAIVAVVLLALIRPRPVRGAGLPGFLFFLAVTAAGLFFLPFLAADLPGVGVLSLPPAEWSYLVAGASGHANALTWSVLPPLLLSLLLLHRPGARGALAGVAAGSAAFLLHALFAGAADVRWIPGRWLDAVWLAVNAGAALMLAATLLRRTAPAAGRRSP